MKKVLDFLTRTVFVLCLAFGVSDLASAQTSISGDIAGTITDTTGAVIPGATIQVTSANQGTVKSATSSQDGHYRVSLLAPGPYKVEVSASNFSNVQQDVRVSAGTIANVDVKLSIGSQSTTIEVTGDAQLLHTDDAQLSTSYSYAQVQSLPNPGNDLTFIAQTAPGSVMNTQGGYGNFSSFGLPGTSNTITVNGGYGNDPFLNLSNSGATNLLLGNNDIDVVTVVSPAYNASFGGLSGAQVVESTRSGGNAFHGNLTYQWNGSALNANSWFNKNAGSPKGRTNANQWAAAIGGPIKRDKAFFFVDTEGLRVIIPVRATVYAPSQAWQNAILSPTPIAPGTDEVPNGNPLVPGGNLAGNGNSSQAPLYQNIFNFFNNAPGAASAIPSQSGDPRFVQFNAQGSNFAQEWILAARFDLNLTNKDKIFIHYKQDKGVQPTQTNVLSPLFNANSPQPSYEGQLNWTRSVSPNITNQFLLTGNYYRAIFTNTRVSEANASVPLVLDPRNGDWSNNELGTANVGGINYAFPQGRTVTGYQVQDDLTITKGRHTITLGYSIRRNLVTDYTPSQYTTPRAIVRSSDNFAAGFIDQWMQRFPTRLTQPLAIYNMGTYLQDQWKVRPNLTLTAGLRLEHNANPTCATNCFSNLAGAFSSLSGLTSTPYNQLIASGRHRAFLQQQAVGVNPRLGFAYQPDSKTTVRGGFGMFTDVFPASIATDLDTNIPGVSRFTLFGKSYGGPSYTLDPNAPNSAASVAAGSAAAFQRAYATGGSFDSISNDTGGLFTQPAFIATQRKVFMPTAEEWSLAVERQLDARTVVSATYVGNHTYHGAVLNNSVNAFGFAGLPDNAPNGSLGAVSVYNSANQSNYHGVVLSANHRSNWMTLGFNYTYSHALDLISNGGFDPFGNNPYEQQNPNNLSQNYGSADYNMTHYVSANYVIDIPIHRGPKLAVQGWQVAGTVFHSSGIPFTVLDSNAAPTNYGSTVFAQQINKGFSQSCGGASHAGVSGTPCAFAATIGSGDDATFANFASATAFGQQRRNTFNGPAYTDTDFTVTKSFQIPLHEASIKVGAQFFNLFNHPNFGMPNNDIASGVGSTGLIQSTVSTPTSILGSFLGGDASPRLIQLVGKINF